MYDPAIDARNVAFARQVHGNPDAGAPLFLSATDPWIQEAQGQLVLLNLANMLPRMGTGFRDIVLDAHLDGNLAPEIARVHGAGRLQPAVLRHLAAAVNGHYDVSSRCPKGSISILVGGATGRQAEWAIYTDGWEVGVFQESAAVRTLGDPTRFNPVAAQLLAASVTAAIYGTIARPEPFVERWPPAGKRWSIWDVRLEGDLPRTIFFPNVTLVGAGAVAQAAFAPLRYLEQARGNLTVIEPDRADKTNLNRYLLLDDRDAERKRLKTEVLKNALTHTQVTVDTVVGSVQSVKDGISDNVILAVDDVDTRWFVQKRWPGVLLEAGTRTDHFHVAHSHRTAVQSGRMACQACLHPDKTRVPRKTREATAVFVSALAGAILAREIHLWFGNVPAEAKMRRLGRGYIAGNAWEPWAVEASPFKPVPSCPVCGQSLHGV